MSGADFIFRFFEYLNEKYPSSRLLKMTFFVLIAMVVLSILYFMLSLGIEIDKILKPYLDKEVQIEIRDHGDKVMLSPKFHLRLDEYNCSQKINSENVFICTVPQREKYSCLLEYEETQVKEEMINKDEEYHKLNIDKTLLIAENCTYKIDNRHFFHGTFKLLDPIKNSIMSPFKDLKIRLCGGPLLTFHDEGGVIKFDIPWKNLSNYYYESCKEGLVFKFEHESLIANNHKIPKHFFFEGNNSCFDIEQPRFIKMNSEQIEFNGQTEKNNVTILKESSKNFLFKFKAKDFTPKTAINIQIDGHTITIEGDSIKFDSQINMLEQNITSQPILEVEMRRDQKNILLDIFQNGKKISIIDNIMILANDKIGKLKIGYYYTGRLSNEPVLSIYDVSIQNWVPVDSSDIYKP